MNKIVAIYPGGDRIKGRLVERYKGFNIYETPEDTYAYAYINPKDRYDYGHSLTLRRVHERINERTTFRGA